MSPGFLRGRRGKRNSVAGKRTGRHLLQPTETASPIADWFLESFFLKYFFQEKTHHASDLGRKKKKKVMSNKQV